MQREITIWSIKNLITSWSSIRYSDSSVFLDVSFSFGPWLGTVTQSTALKVRALGVFKRE
ncbi:hypothetical protein CY34DRAFT_806844 [Suillus luteus UH-Slu-Lm8-n1]|uniref:Uncharacterized protein n=1 Tax=Suillus luteus UH-Slu-Lm8-n1 TaxID=930992 RepID=A0A0D0BB22_9AGAM|nr:hypothetical protein CY34DRAFT_806844 [Suillus luteus UH-Slu-Lm8-n1]